MENDMISLAKMVASNIAKDGASQNYIEAFKKDDSELINDFCSLYMEVIEKKIKLFQEEYVTNDRFKREFRSIVQNSL